MSAYGMLLATSSASTSCITKGSERYSSLNTGRVLVSFSSCFYTHFVDFVDFVDFAIIITIINNLNQIIEIILFNNLQCQHIYSYNTIIHPPRYPNLNIPVSLLSKNARNVRHI